MTAIGEMLPIALRRRMSAYGPRIAAGAGFPELGYLALYERQGWGSWLPTGLKVTVDRHWPEGDIGFTDRQIVRVT